MNGYSLFAITESQSEVMKFSVRGSLLTNLTHTLLYRIVRFLT